MNRTQTSFAVLAMLLLIGALPSSSAAQAKAGNSAAAKVTNAAGPTALQIAERIQGFYDRTRTFKSKFKQRYTIRGYNKQIDSTGQVIFQKPGKMSWRYTNNGNRVVSDGTTIKVYEKENKQMFIQTMNKSQYPAALSFLVGGASLKTSFLLRKLDAKQLRFEGGYVIEAKPRESSPAYQTMLIYADAKTNQVRRVLILDAQGNRNRFDFVGPEVNVNVPVTEFAFQPPSGTQIVRS